MDHQITERSVMIETLPIETRKPAPEGGSAGSEVTPIASNMLDPEEVSLSRRRVSFAESARESFRRKRLTRPSATHSPAAAPDPLTRPSATLSPLAAIFWDMFVRQPGGLYLPTKRMERKGSSSKIWRSQNITMLISTLMNPNIRKGPRLDAGGFSKSDETENGATAIFY